MSLPLLSHAHKSPRRARRLAAAAAAAGLGVASLAVHGPANAGVETTPSVKVRTLSDPAIVESSGLARSMVNNTRLWTHNDSGGGNTIYAIGSGGETVRSFQLTGATHKDWEGMASAKVGGVAYLYVGDIGGSRTNVFVHRVTEPSNTAPSGSLAPTTYQFSYPDGAHNAEGMMVNPQTGRIHIVSKVKGAPGGIYQAPATLSTTSVNRLTKVGTAPAGMSDAVYLNDGQRFVLRGYNNSWLYTSFTATPVGFTMPVKGESISTDWNDTHVYVGSEGVRSSIWRVQLPA